MQPLYMYFSRSSEGTKVLEAACQAAGVKLDRGRIVGSPDRLNLFTIEGDLLRGETPPAQSNFHCTRALSRALTPLSAQCVSCRQSISI